MRPSCVTCHKLRDCDDVTAPRIEQRYRCDRWDAAGPIELGARKQLVENFGVWALQFDVPKLEKKRRPKARRRRKDG